MFFDTVSGTFYRWGNLGHGKYLVYFSRCANFKHSMVNTVPGISFPLDQDFVHLRGG